jgi:sugar phosphate isomerase/epimerase
VEFLNITHFDDVGFCFDIGHAHMMGSVEEAFSLMQKHIRTTHLHDNNKDRDSHLWPGDGSINWARAMELLRTAPHVPPMLLEIEGEGKTNIPDGAGKAFNKLADAGKARV